MGCTEVICCHCSNCIVLSPPVPHRCCAWTQLRIFDLMSLVFTLKVLHRRQTLSESVWWRSVRAAKCEMSGFAPSKCEVSDFAYAKCEMSGFEPSKYAKCEVSGFALAKCTVQIVPAPEHFARTTHARARARAPPHAFRRCLSILYIYILYTGTLYYGYVVGGGRCETMYANACAAARAVR